MTGTRQDPRVEPVRLRKTTCRDTAIIASASELLGIWPDLDDVAVIGLDLRDAQLDWSAARVRSTLFLGCLLPDGESDRLGARGAVVLSGFRDAPFQPYRADLYTYDELMAGHERGARATLDAQIGTWFTNSSTSLHDAVLRALHDATIDACGRALCHEPPSRRRHGRARARA